MTNMSESADLSESAKVPQDFVTRLENETKFEEAMDTDEDVNQNQVVDANKIKLEENLEPNEDADKKLRENFVVEPENVDTKPNNEKVDDTKLPVDFATEPEENKTKLDEMSEKVNQKVPEIFVSEQTKVEKSLEEASKNVDVENEEMVETGKGKRKVTDDDSEESKKSKNVAKKPKLEIDLSNPKFLKPFDLGWKRELVYRSINDGNKKNGDIYYYTPAGKKLRSMREVAENLNDDVTIENFTFAKKPLGLKDREKEIVRNANSKPGGLKKGTPKIKTVTPKPIKTPTLKRKRVTTPEVIATLTPLQKREVRESTRERSKRRKIAEENIMEVSTPKLPKLEAKSKKRKRTVTFADTKIKLPQPQKKIKLDTENFFEDVAAGYKIFLNVFKYLNVKDLLIASRVSKMWNFMANNHALWETVHMKGSHLHSCKGMVKALKKNGTVHLDLSKVVLPKNKDFWDDFTNRIRKVKTLRKISLFRCPAEVVDELCMSNPKLEVLNVVMINNSESMKITRLADLINLQELYLKASSPFPLTADLNTLNELKYLTHLSLTSINNLNQLDLSAIGNLSNLKSLGLGECVDLPASFTKEVLSKLNGLKHLRLEKGQGNCCNLEIFEEIKNLQHLEQLELINFDIKIGFDRALGECTQIKKLLLIPNYASQSSLTIHLVLRGVMHLETTLTHFVWGITTQLIKTTDILVDQHNKEQSEEEKKISNAGNCVPILQPVPNLENLMENVVEENEVHFISLSELQKVLLKNIPNTSVKMLKIPFQYTWKQSLQAW